MGTVDRKFSDLDLNFLPHPVSGDIQVLSDAEAVKRALKNLLFTGVGERLFQSELGANLRQLLFEPISPMSELSIQVLIRDSVRIFEPRVSILSLRTSISEDETGYDVLLVFAIDQLSEVVTIDFFLERLR